MVQACKYWLVLSVRWACNTAFCLLTFFLSNKSHKGRDSKPCHLQVRVKFHYFRRELEAKPICLLERNIFLTYRTWANIPCSGWSTHMGKAENLLSSRMVPIKTRGPLPLRGKLGTLLSKICHKFKAEFGCHRLEEGVTRMWEDTTSGAHALPKIETDQEDWKSHVSPWSI